MKDFLARMLFIAWLCLAVVGASLGFDYLNGRWIGPWADKVLGANSPAIVWVELAVQLVLFVLFMLPGLKFIKSLGWLEDERG